jgi:hypothetical protein
LGTLGVIYAVTMLTTVAWLVVSVPLTIALGVPVRGVQLGAPRLFTLRMRGIPVSFGPFPASTIDTSGEELPKLPPAKSVVLRLLPWLVLLGFAAPLLGPGRALRSFLHAFHQLFLELDLTPLVRAFFAIAEHAPVGVTFGIVLAKLAALNVLPLVTLGGGGTIADVLESRGRKIPATWFLLSLVALLYIAVRLIWAVAKAI